MDVSTWLRDLGLEDYVQAFQANHIDPQVLPRLTADDLIGLGVISIGHRRKLIDAIVALDHEGSTPSGAMPGQGLTEDQNGAQWNASRRTSSALAKRACPALSRSAPPGDPDRVPEDGRAGNDRGLSGRLPSRTARIRGGR
jgi:hypothetical protein